MYRIVNCLYIFRCSRDVKSSFRPFFGVMTNTRSLLRKPYIGLVPREWVGSVCSAFFELFYSILTTSIFFPFIFVSTGQRELRPPARILSNVSCPSPSHHTPHVHSSEIFQHIMQPCYLRSTRLLILYICVIKILFCIRLSSCVLGGLTIVFDEFLWILWCPRVYITCISFVYFLLSSILFSSRSKSYSVSFLLSVCFVFFFFLTSMSQLRK